MAMVGLNFKLTTLDAGSLRDILGRGTFCWRASDRGGGGQKRRGSRYLSGSLRYLPAVHMGDEAGGDECVAAGGLAAAFKVAPPMLFKLLSGVSMLHRRSRY